MKNAFIQNLMITTITAVLHKTAIFNDNEHKR